MSALPIPAVAARIEARTKQRRARNETRDSRVTRDCNGSCLVGT
jgi:hypothetical protein